MVVDDNHGIRQVSELADQKPDGDPRLRGRYGHPHEVSEVIDVLRSRLESKEVRATGSSHLIWCTAMAATASRIHRRRQTDTVPAERALPGPSDHRAAGAAADARSQNSIMARPPHTLKKEKLIEGVGGMRIMDDVGIKVHKMKHLKLHGKMLLADGLRAIVGSINLAPGSFDSRRELAIEVRRRRGGGTTPQNRAP